MADNIVARLFALLGLKVDKKSFNKANKGIKQTTDAMQTLKKVAGTAFAGFTVYKVASEFRDISREADRVAKSAKAFAISAKDFQRFEFAAARAGLTTEQLGMAMRGIPKRLAAANFGSKEAIDLFGRLGLSVDKMIQMNPADQFRALAGSLSAIENPTKRAGFAFKLFEESGQKLLPLFEGGQKGLKKLEDEFDSLGGGFDAETLAKAEAFEDSMTNLGVVGTRLKGVFFKLLFPMTKVIGAFTEFSKTKGFVKLQRVILAGLAVLGAAFVAFGTVVALSNLPMILTVLSVIAVLGGLALAIEDVVSYFEGKDSFFGDFVEQAKDVALWLEKILRLTAFFDGGVKNAIEQEFVDQGLRASPKTMFDKQRDHMLASEFDDIANFRPSAPGPSSSMTLPTMVVNMEINGAGSPEATAQAVTGGLKRELGRRNRNAMSSLTPGVR